MAKILVADDNSNVQKTAGLALAELGVEVVAVNNGEAAVRKLGEVAPDLVLADIFMPVRNGYEVCEYVKKDARFSNIPVVLLVGAFDPLDEREAQRVGADGILKKPFVPPDPLITMVKMLLDRTLGDRLVAVGAQETAAATMRNKAGSSSATATAVKPPVSAPPVEEAPEEEFHVPADRVSFGEGARPMAFGQLLETPVEEASAAGTGVVEPVDDDQILTRSRDASLGDPIFWKSSEPEPESAEASAEGADEDSADIPIRSWKPEESSRAREAETDFLQPVETFELVRDDKDGDAAQTPTIVESTAIIESDPASQAALTVEAGKPEDLAANPIEWMATAPSPAVEEMVEASTDWNAAIAEAQANPEEHEAAPIKFSSEPVTEPELASNVKLAAPVADSASAPISAPPIANAAEPVESAVPVAQAAKPENEQPATQSSTLAAEETPHSVAKQHWSDLAASLQAKSATGDATKSDSPSAASSAVTLPPAADNRSFPTKAAPPVFKRIDQSAEETARSIPKQEWADLTARLQNKPGDNRESKPEQNAAPVDASPAAPNADVPPPAMNSAPIASKTTDEEAAEEPFVPPARRDWADLSARLQAKREGLTSEPGSAGPMPAAPLHTDSESRPSATGSQPAFSKLLDQASEASAHSVSKRDWNDLSGSLPEDGSENRAESTSAPSASAVPSASAASDARPASSGSATTTPKPFDQSAVDTARAISKTEWANLAANLQTKRGDSNSGNESGANESAGSPWSQARSSDTPASNLANSGSPAANLQSSVSSANFPAGAPDPALVEAVVQRILEKMRPQVVDIITKEFLRPIVQALVHREIQKR